MVGGLAMVLVFATIAKVDGWRAWRPGIGDLLGLHAPGTRLFVAAGIPVAEGVIAVGLLIEPRWGAAGACALFAALGIGVWMLLPAHTGEKCNCFGVAASSTISRGLVVRNLILALIALATFAMAARTSAEPFGLPQYLMLVLGLIAAAILHEGAQLLGMLRREGMAL